MPTIIKLSNANLKKYELKKLEKKLENEMKKLKESLNKLNNPTQDAEFEKFGNH